MTGPLEQQLVDRAVKAVVDGVPTDDAPDNRTAAFRAGVLAGANAVGIEYRQHGLEARRICPICKSQVLKSDDRAYMDGWHHKDCLDRHMEGRFQPRPHAARGWSTEACPEHGDHCDGPTCCCADKHPPEGRLSDLTPDEFLPGANAHADTYRKGWKAGRDDERARVLEDVRAILAAGLIDPMDCWCRVDGTLVLAAIRREDGFEPR